VRRRCPARGPTSKTARASLANAEADYQRKAGLSKDQLIARSDLDLAKSARDQARAQVAAAQAQITQQQASTQTSQLNLQRTVIRSPVDGVVLTRSIEPGQTVAASLQAPVLFQIAEDLSKMEIVLQIDEADIGQVKSGQGVNFTVDAFPDRSFRGTVQQVRLSATNTNNVITYPVVVSVDNRDQVLLPGMTANAEIEVSRRDGVLKLPNAALRFKPADDDASSDGAAPTQSRGALAGELPNLAAALQLRPAQQSAFDEALKQMRDAIGRAAGAPQQGGVAQRVVRPPPGAAGRQRTSRSAARTRRCARDAGALQQRIAAFRRGHARRADSDADGKRLTRWSARAGADLQAVDGKPQSGDGARGGVSEASTEGSAACTAGDAVIVGAQRRETAHAMKRRSPTPRPRRG
jgi:HlyD family secretion protein